MTFHKNDNTFQELSHGKSERFCSEKKDLSQAFTRAQMSTKNQGFEKESIYGKNILGKNSQIVVIASSQTTAMTKKWTAKPAPAKNLRQDEFTSTTQTLRVRELSSDVNMRTLTPPPHRAPAQAPDIVSGFVLNLKRADGTSPRIILDYVKQARHKNIMRRLGYGEP
jgi:hypothetical protein